VYSPPSKESPPKNKIAFWKRLDEEKQLEVRAEKEIVGRKRKKLVARGKVISGRERLAFTKRLWILLMDLL
jgi:hypothetical protein